MVKKSKDMKSEKPTYKSCKMQMLYFDGSPPEEAECQVRFDTGKLTVSYDGYDGVVIYKGIEKSAGHYEMVSPEVKGHGSLHCFPDAAVKFLEGFWIEEGYTGMWRIAVK